MILHSFYPCPNEVNRGVVEWAKRSILKLSGHVWRMGSKELCKCMIASFSPNRKEDHLKDRTGWRSTLERDMDGGSAWTSKEGVFDRERWRYFCCRQPLRGRSRGSELR